LILLLRPNKTKPKLKQTKQKMEPSFQWVNIGGSRDAGIFTWFSKDKGKSNGDIKVIKVIKVIEIMGALIQDPNKFRKDLQSLIYPDSILCLGGELKAYGTGQPASNYRYSKGKTKTKTNAKNENVIQNYFHLIKTYNEVTGKPIIVTTIPRSWRHYSFFLQENGKIERKDEKLCREINESEGQFGYTGPPPGGEDNWKENDLCLSSMLGVHGVTQEKMKKLRQSCAGAKFNTYLIDMISFLYQLKIGTPEFHSTFTPEYRSICAIRGGDSVGKWTPETDTSYLYMNKTTENDGFVFYVPLKSSVNAIYNDFDNAISSEDNEMKKKIRDHCIKTQIDRWTDFDVNDTDDAFTIIMIMHAFNCQETLSPEGEIVLKKLTLILKPWFAQLY